MNATPVQETNVFDPRTVVAVTYGQSVNEIVKVPAEPSCCEVDKVHTESYE